MNKHFTLLGWFYIALSAIGLLAALIVFVALVGFAPITEDQTAIAVMSITGVLTSGLILLIFAPGLIVGIGLLQHRPWARVLALLLGFVSLFAFPIGTALGIYTIWVLIDDRAAQSFAVPF